MFGREVIGVLVRDYYASRFGRRIEGSGQLALGRKIARVNEERGVFVLKNQASMRKSKTAHAASLESRGVTRRFC